MENRNLHAKYVPTPNVRSARSYILNIVKQY